MVPEKTCEDMLALPSVGPSLPGTFACPPPPFLMKRQAAGLKMGKTAPAPVEGRSRGGAGGCPRAAVSGGRAVRSRSPTLSSSSRIARPAMSRSTRRSRDRCQLRRQAGADRPQGERSVRPAARRAFRGPGSEGHRRGPLDPRPDGASSLSGRQRGLVPDLEGAAGRRGAARFQGLAGISRDAPALSRPGLGPGGPFRRARFHRRPSR